MPETLPRVVLHDAKNKQWLRFSKPVQEVRAERLDDVLPALERIQELTTSQELYAAGFISYQASPAFDSALQVFSTKEKSAFPLLWFGLYSSPEVITLPLPKRTKEPLLFDWEPSVSKEAYEAAIRKVKSHLAAGDSYQANYTFRLTSAFESCPWQLFLHLMQAQPTQYAAFIEHQDFALCSASPELFFERYNGTLSCRPMKGTASRGLTFAQDLQQSQWLHHSEKNRAENVMIVDMIRNDLGRLADFGSVQVKKLFEVERYPTVWQMTSSIEAQSDKGLVDCFSALFPCASITGAPKPKTMEIIAALETTPRDVYTGCMGFITPEQDIQCNVTIRTVQVDKRKGKAIYGVGGGIVWDSEEKDEYEECKLKARVVSAPLETKVFSLLETILWSPEDDYFLLLHHLQRLRQSACYFSLPFSHDTIYRKLVELRKTFEQKAYKVRVLLARDGQVACEAMPLNETSERPVRLGIAKKAVDTTSPFLYHKTTLREVYQRYHAEIPDCDDVLLYNEHGEVTESTIANVVIRQDGQLLTPPVECGLLAGTFRAHLLEQGLIQEKVILLDELHECEAIYVINSVRKWRDATLAIPDR